MTLASDFHFLSKNNQNINGNLNLIHSRISFPVQKLHQRSFYTFIAGIVLFLNNPI